MSYQSLETRVGNLLIEHAGLKEEDLAKVLLIQKESGKKVGEILIEQKLVRPEDISKALAMQLGLPFVEDLKPQEIDATVVERLSIQYCRENKILPIYQTDDFVRVAVADPFHYEPLDALKILYKKKIETVIALPQRLDDAINVVFERSDNMIKGLETSEDNYDADLDETMDLLESTDDEAPVIRFVNSLLFRAIKDKASDIHIEPFEKFVQVRFRIDGILYDVYKAPKNLHAAISSRIKVMAELNIAEKRVPQDGRIKTRLAGREIDIRLSVVPVAAGERLVMRLLDKSSVVLDLPKLGFEEESMKKIAELTDRKYGIFLVTGPTGSGKSTTLSACLKNINSPERNIITVEDPIEYQLPGVGQIAVNEKVGLSFASGLRSILRQDPDVVMVGEIRDRETAEIAINASLTGHLVLSTLHTNDAPGAITRLVDMGIEPFLVSSSIVGVLAQRLIRKICPHCSSEYTPSVEVVEGLGTTMNHLEKLSPKGAVTFYRSKGCSECRFTGYVGRMAIYELMVVSDEIRALILKETDAGTIRKQATKEGMLSLRQSALSKLCQGATTVEEIIRITQLDE
ncbi:MAG TPA: type II secretion system ATPase GspE [Bdellovibrionota bacterium]|nr:type II secretion system ATPase GspE [Bdellovibrionota bacterium]